MSRKPHTSSRVTRDKSTIILSKYDKMLDYIEKLEKANEELTERLEQAENDLVLKDAAVASMFEEGCIITDKSVVRANAISKQLFDEMYSKFSKLPFDKFVKGVSGKIKVECSPVRETIERMKQRWKDEHERKVKIAQGHPPWKQ